jgi:L-alanine-DL-glutamate epimerase-like enolase superfamily enzyme
MAAGSAPDVRNGLLKVPAGPGLGLEINTDFLRKNLAPGEEYWG